MTTHNVVLNVGVPTTYSYISAATHPIIINLVPHRFIDIGVNLMVQYSNCLLCIFMHINGNLKKILEMRENQKKQLRGVPTKFPLF